MIKKLQFELILAATNPKLDVYRAHRSHAHEASNQIMHSCRVATEAISPLKRAVDTLSVDIITAFDCHEDVLTSFVGG